MKYKLPSKLTSKTVSLPFLFAAAISIVIACLIVVLKGLAVTAILFAGVFVFIGLGLLSLAVYMAFVKRDEFKMASFDEFVDLFPRSW